MSEAVEAWPREVVLDACVVMRWFELKTVPHEATAAFQRDFEAGRIFVTVPHLLFLEVLNVAGRQWQWSGDALADLATRLGALGFDVAEPTLAAVADWVSRGLTAYDAVYVALAQERGLPLITHDADILAIAPDVARPLSAPQADA